MTAATIPTRSPRRIPWFWLALVATVCLVALPALNAHATARHGRTASSAHRYVSRCDPGDPRYWCGRQDDGRLVHIVELDKLPGKPRTWAIVVTGACGCVTAFLSQSRRHVERKRQECG